MFSAKKKSCSFLCTLLDDGGVFCFFFYFSFFFFPLFFFLVYLIGLDDEVFLGCIYKLGRIHTYSRMMMTIMVFLWMSLRFSRGLVFVGIGSCEIGFLDDSEFTLNEAQKIDDEAMK